MSRRALLTGLVLLFGCGLLMAEEPTEVVKDRGQVTFRWKGQALATYVTDDPQILRPYFTHLKALSGQPLTRTHPPVEGPDPVDHPTMHPGVWLAFGDVGGGDFWRNKARIEHVRFLEEPRKTESGFEFRVENQYVFQGDIVCTENRRHVITVVEQAGEVPGWWLTFDSEFTCRKPVAFGDQEEMGLGVRIASPLRVKSGYGKITNDRGDRNEAGVWGKPATWCDYQGTVDERTRGILLVANKANPWLSRFHVRDYGLMVANPIGQKAFKVSPPMLRTLSPDFPLRLRYDLFFYDVPASQQFNPADVAKAVPH